LVARINALLRQVVDSSDMRDRLRIQGVEPQIQSPDQFREKVRSEIERWGPVIEKSGIKGSL
jgi:tripartite-type tricarboxylate transporter receptor subunit TctC